VGGFEVVGAPVGGFVTSEAVELHQLLEVGGLV